MPRPMFDLSRVSIHAPGSPQLQRKPVLSEPGDALEREADAIADRVMGGGGPSAIGVSPGNAIARQCAGCEEDEKKVQTKRTDNASHRPMDVGTAVRTAERGGEPLPRSVRERFEPRFGYDFGNVRVHTGEDAMSAAHGVQARAYTVGRDIVFGQGQFAPETHEGQRLLAHELAHVVQQGGATADRVMRAPAVEEPPAPAAVEPPAPAAEPPAAGPDPDAEPMQNKPAPGTTMPLALYFISKTKPRIQKSGVTGPCDRDLWAESDVKSAASAAAGIMSTGFGINLSYTVTDVGCDPDAVIVADGAKNWLSKRTTAADKTNMYFIAQIQGGGDATYGGEVSDIGENAGVISKESSNPGRTLAHELGHTLNLEHPAGAAGPCAGMGLMEQGGGTCVEGWEKKKALKYGKNKGRLT
ncbi:MAG: DUF4157 domain-containing protein [Minicystis sp.]